MQRREDVLVRMGRLLPSLIYIISLRARNFHIFIHNAILKSRIVLILLAIGSKKWYHPFLVLNPPPITVRPSPCPVLKDGEGGVFGDRAVCCCSLVACVSAL